MLCFKNAPAMNIGKDLIDLSKDAEILRSGVVRCRGFGTLSQRLWKKRRLTLVENALLIGPSQRLSSSEPQTKRIPLKSVTNIERVDLTPACLMLELSCGRKCYLSFEDDAILYDWQDDIYPRSRLGNFSNPFNFVHETHLTNDDFLRDSNRLSALRNRMQSTPSRRRKSSVATSHQTSSELDRTRNYHHSLLPMRAIYDFYAKPYPEPIKVASHTRTNSASTSSTYRYVFDPSIHPTGSLTSSAPPVVLEGLYQVKRVRRRSLLPLWHERYVVLTSRTLQIRKPQDLASPPIVPSRTAISSNFMHIFSNRTTPWHLPIDAVIDDAIHQSSHPEVTIRLPHITDVSQLKFNSKPFVLSLTTENRRRYYISLPNTSDLSGWSDHIALRRKRADISDPNGFEFHVHVSWDSKSQAFVGLPDEWKPSLELQEKERTMSTMSSPVTEQSPIKDMGPSCTMCYDGLQCAACKYDLSYASTTSGSPKSRYQGKGRSRPFSVTSGGSTLIGDHENQSPFRF